ncbi:mucin-5AC-like [Drosophila madeirensis]|uniref:Mucin-5AC-like n=1 Tax=Drosophila madeirensis TaxID=30013 RepID=A0AAU9FQS1_DROMD
MQKITAILALACGLLAFVSAQKCQECQSGNSAYCHSQTEYRNCMQNNPIGDIVSCDSGYVCSNTEDVCVLSYLVDGSSVLDVCGASGGNGDDCEVCSGSNKYSCVSKTQFVRCVDQQASTANVYSCATDEICVIEALATHGTLCVPTCAATFLNETATCSNSEYVAPPNPTVPTLDEQVKACKEAGELPANSNLPYFYTRYTNDATCSSYLYCEKISSVTWLAILYHCKRAQPFFDSASSRCVAIRPEDCAATTTSSPQEPTTSSSAGPTESTTTAEPTTSGPSEPTESSTSSSSEASSETPATTVSTNSPQEPTESSTSSSSEASSESTSTLAPTTSIPQESSETPTSSVPQEPTESSTSSSSPQEPTESSTNANSEASSEASSTPAPTSIPQESSETPTSSVPQEPTESSTSSSSPQEPTESSTNANSVASSEASSTPAPTTSIPQESSETPGSTVPTSGPQEPTESSTSSNSEASDETPATTGSTTSAPENQP